MLAQLARQRDAGKAAADEITHIWRLTLGKRLPERRALLEGYLRNNPSSPYAAVLASEIEVFKREEAELAKAATAAPFQESRIQERSPGQRAKPQPADAGKLQYEPAPQL